MSLLAIPREQVCDMHPPWPLKPYSTTLIWWSWECDCGVRSDPANAWSGPASALDRGEYHQERTQCQVVGQLALFALSVNTNGPRAGLAIRGAGRS